MNKLLAEVIKIKLRELLISIQTNYKEYISKEDIAKEFKSICSRITLRTKQNNNKTKKKKKREVINSYFTNIPEDERCEGRSWGRITEVNGKKVYGYRCKNRKLKDGKYCYIHKYKLTHGNFLVEPDKYLKYHFIVRNKLRDKREKKKGKKV